MRPETIDPVTDFRYPNALIQKLGLECRTIYAFGNIELLNHSYIIGGVGSRDASEEEISWAREIGFKAAQKGIVVVSGDAAGSDRAFQNGCLGVGGAVIAIVPEGIDRLIKEYSFYLENNQIVIIEPQLPGAQWKEKAFYRNLLIHAMAERVFVASFGRTPWGGGTFQGVNQNLQRGLSKLTLKEGILIPETLKGKI